MSSTTTSRRVSTALDVFFLVIFYGYHGMHHYQATTWDNSKHRGHANLSRGVFFFFLTFGDWKKFLSIFLDAKRRILFKRNPQESE